MSYDDDNRLIMFNLGSIVNDNNGNMTSGPVTNSIQQLIPMMPETD